MVEAVHPFFFIHIPKTAGTSFRVALEHRFEARNVWADYSPEAPETHPAVLDFIYGKNDPFGLLAAMHSQSKSQCVLTGHVTRAKFGDLFPITRVITFVRDPLSRLVSEYKHFLRYLNYQDSFAAFMEMSRNINAQTRYLAGAPLTTYGFIGLTEEYDCSLKMINSNYNFQLQNLDLNKASPEQEERCVISSEEALKFEELNRADIQLYDVSRQIFEERKKLFLARQNYTHGEYLITDDRVMRGFAFQRADVVPVALVVEHDNEVVAEVDAKEFNPQMRRLDSPRKGCVGFSLSLKGHMRAEDPFRVWVKETGQMLPRV